MENAGSLRSSTFSSDDIVIKSPNDRRLYRLIQLHNGLSALLVHDPEICAGADTSNPDGEDDGNDDSDEDLDDAEDEDEEDDDEEEDEDEDEDMDMDEKDDGTREGKAATSQTKKVDSY